jgi:hypothetical protein
MNKHELWIFGDSFSDPNGKFGYEGNEDWPRLIKKYYNVKNYSIIGSGPHTMLYKLIKKCHSRAAHAPCTLVDVTVLFFLSDHKRIPLECTSNRLQNEALIADVGLGRDLPEQRTMGGERPDDGINRGNSPSHWIASAWKSTNLTRPSAKPIEWVGADQLSIMLDNTHFNDEDLTNIIWFFRQYVLNDTFDFTDPLKTICTLKCLSIQFKKIIVLPCLESYQEQSKFFNPLIDYKFFIEKYSLRSKYVCSCVAGMQQCLLCADQAEREKNKAIVDSTMPNHIPIEKHKEFLDYLRNLISPTH